MRRFILGVVVTVWLVPGANADNGVLEINAACVSVGCFSGDDPDWPVEIENPGSYILTSNLTVPDENTNGIRVSTNDVGIDLNNFAIIGPVTCAGGPLTCSHSSGTGSGVTTAVGVTGTSVQNGSITGMGLHGVLLGNQAEVTNLRVRWNRSRGISASHGSMVSGSEAYQNGSVGILVQYSSTVSGSSAYENGDHGIIASTGSTVSGNVARGNGGDGIQTSTGSAISDNAAYQNSNDGIDAASGSTVSNNSVYENGSDGIRVHSGSMVSGNTMRKNLGYGLYVSGIKCGYSENVISDNVTAAVFSSSQAVVELGLNACDGDTECP